MGRRNRLPHIKQGKTIYFCTRQCNNRFDADPEAALQALER
jgi:YHS domain-containing protein